MRSFFTTFIQDTPSSSLTPIQFNPLSSSSLLAGACKHTHPTLCRISDPTEMPFCWLLLCNTILNKVSWNKRPSNMPPSVSPSGLTTVRHSKLRYPTSYLVLLHHSFLISCPLHLPLWDFSSKYFVGYSYFFCWYFTAIWGAFFFSHLFTDNSEIQKA